MRFTEDHVREDIKNILESEARKSREIERFTNEAVQRFEIPFAMANDYITRRRPLSDANDFILFILLSVIKPEKLSTYFTEMEIASYGKSKFNVSKIKLPLVMPMLQVKYDQWIGAVTVQKLMEFDKAQLIYYNENTQRPMRHIINGGEERYEIFLNNTAVNGIRRSLKQSQYIPNTITLNIPEDAEIFYDNTAHELHIDKIDHFDILDGYHRYVAMRRIYSSDPSFDYEMELRLVCFDEERANQFIWQEDQKTKMRKVDSDFRNQYDPVNRIVNDIKISPKCNDLFKVNADGRSIIDPADFSAMLRVVYFSDKNTKNDPKYAVEVKRKLINMLSLVTIEDTDLLEKKWHYSFILGFLIGTKLYDDSADVLSAARFLYESKSEVPAERSVSKAAVVKWTKAVSRRSL